MELRLALASDALVRTYVTDEGMGWIAVRSDGQRLRLQLADRVLCELADGQRTLEELRTEAQRRLARPIERTEIEERTERLIYGGVLLSLEDAEIRAREIARPWTENLIAQPVDESTPIALLSDGARFRCHGAGSCCRLEERLIIGADDFAQLERAFGDDELTPARLSLRTAVQRSRSGALIVAARDGHCALLEEDGRCGVEVRLGAAGKPLRCRTQPLRGVLDGGVLHAALSFACRCAGDASSADPPLDGSPLIEALRAGGAALEVAPTIAGTATRPMPRDAWRALRERLLAATRTAPDPALAILDEAAALVTGRGPAAPWSRLAPLLPPVAQHLDDQAAWCEAVYLPDDLHAIVLRFGAAAARRDAAAPATEAERRMLRHALWSHAPLQRRAASTGLAALALAAWLARAGAELPLPPALTPLSAAAWLLDGALGELFDREASAVDAALASLP